MKIVLRICLLLFIAAGSVFPQIGSDLSKVGSTSAQFLKIDVGPRAIGMGGAFTALSDDINSFHWNPAGLAKINNAEAYFNHVDWILDVNLDFAGVAVEVPSLGTLGGYVSVMSMGEELVRTIEAPEGTGEFFNAGALLIGVSFARNLTDEFSIGFNAKYINEYIWNENASTFAVDIGTMYIIPFMNKFRIGASISNFGPKMQLSGRDIAQLDQRGPGDGNIIETNLKLDQFDLPLLFRFGVAVDAVSSESNRLTLAVDAVHPNDNTEQVNAGLEYTWNEVFFVRGGYRSIFEADSEKGLTLGVGLNYRLIETLTVKIDYAYQDFGRLNNVQYFSLGIKF